MAATHRLKGIGWFAVLAGVVLAWYLVSLQGAAERKKLDTLNGRIVAAERDIRALETEFDTRANLLQLERWNGEALALAAPTAAQFVASEEALASIDPNAAGSEVKVAALVVPALSTTPALAPAVTAPAMRAPVVAVAVRSPINLLPAAFTGSVSPSAPARRPANLLPAGAFAHVVAPSGRNAPTLARLAEAARGQAAVARVRPQAVAMLDRKLLSDNTFGDILSGARREAQR